MSGNMFQENQEMLMICIQGQKVMCLDFYYQKTSLSSSHLNNLWCLLALLYPVTGNRITLWNNIFIISLHFSVPAIAFLKRLDRNHGKSSEPCCLLLHSQVTGQCLHKPLYQPSWHINPLPKVTDLIF